MLCTAWWSYNRGFSLPRSQKSLSWSLACSSPVSRASSSPACFTCFATEIEAPEEEAGFFVCFLFALFVCLNASFVWSVLRSLRFLFVTVFLLHYLWACYCNVSQKIHICTFLLGFFSVSPNLSIVLLNWAILWPVEVFLQGNRLFNNSIWATEHLPLP